jgi:trimeric autotransporter adhesin
MIMVITLKRLSVILAICCFFFLSSVQAATPITTIYPGNLVFVGEQGLDITAAMNGDTLLGWWASGAAISGTAPDRTILVSNPTSFSVSPSEFAPYPGSWFHLSSPGTANGTAFTVIDPQLDLRVEDTTVNVDVTDKWVPLGDEIRFRIDSNLVPIAQRVGVGSIPITIKVQAPDGGIYSSLIDRNGVATSVDIPVTTTPFYTNSIWDTGQRATYSPGTYTIWAECNVNSMKDNYNQAGKTVSRKTSLLNQDQNPLINNKGYVTNPTTSPATATPQTVVSTVKTTVSPSPVITTQVPTTVIIPSPSIIVPSANPTAEVPVSTRTKSPGFDAALGMVSLMAGLVLYSMKK